MTNAFDVVDMFERTVASYCGARYGVAVESCSSALLLCCHFHKVSEGPPVELPARTYFSAANAVIHAGGKIKFEDLTWKGAYPFNPYPIMDAARRFTKGMCHWVQNKDWCVSFHGKKILNLGRGGMILTNNKDARDWYRAARFDGRTPGVPCAEDQLQMVGHHMYMTPETAAQGLVHMSFIADKNDDLTDRDPDLRLQEVYKPYIV